MWNESTIAWNESTILWNGITLTWNESTWNETTMERNDRKPCQHCPSPPGWQQISQSNAPLIPWWEGGGCWEMDRVANGKLKTKCAMARKAFLLQALGFDFPKYQKKISLLHRGFFVYY